MKQVNGIYLPDKEEAWIYQAVRDTGTFETDRIPYMLKHVKSFRRAIDGGANCGLWSIELAKHFQMIEAFECAAEMIEPLTRNTEAEGNIVVRPKALGGKYERGAMGEYVNPKNRGCGYVVSGEEFDVIPLDSYGWTDVDLLKLDVEGMELAALVGATKTIEASHPVIMIEQKALAHHSDGFEGGRFLETIGYREVGHINKDYIYA